MAKRQTSNEIESMIANETVIEKDVSTEMQRSFLTYAVMTVVGRALPDARDGLKPVQRRILYSMYDQNIKPSGSYKKSARIVGDVIGRFHPHGDCMRADTKVYLADGTIKTIKELYDNQKAVQILAIDEKTGKPRAEFAYNFKIGQYADKVYHLKLNNGSEICCTGNHPIMLDDLSWVNAENIKVGSRLYSGNITKCNGKNYPMINMAYENNYVINHVNTDNSYLTQEYDKNQHINKAIIIIKELLKLNKDLTVENYDLIRNNNCDYPVIENMIKTNQIASFKELCDMAQDPKYQPIIFDKDEAYNELQIIENSLDNYLANSNVHYNEIIQFFNYLVDNNIEITRENYVELCEEKQYPRINTVEQLFGFDNILNFYNNKFLRIVDVVIENVDKEPMYDFTVNKYHNMLIVTNDNNGTLSVTPVHNTSCYGAMTNLINDFDIRYPLVDGHGNFGSNDGDGAAAMRYTEAKLEKLAMEMLQDIDNNGVEMNLNFSEDEWEPVVLPAKVPYLLVNGASGIATGYTTEIPSHNMNEVCDGIIATIKNPDITVEELVAKHIKGPDLPSYGYLINDDSILQLYKTGQATLKFRGKIETEVNSETNNKQIVITEIPPAVSKPALLKKLYDIYVSNKDKKVIDLRDESEGNGIRIVLELHKTAIPEILIQDLYDNTPLSKSKSYILRAIVEQAPLLLNVKQIIEYYIDQRKDVIERRTKYKLEKLEKKINILNGFKIIINDVKNVVNTIIDSDSPSDASDKIKVQYGLNDEQIKAVLTTQLSSLTRMEKDKVIKDLQTLEAEAEGYREILSSGQKVNQVIISELKELKKTYGDDRKTKIIDLQDQSSPVVEVEVSNEPMFIGLTNKNLIKTMPYTTFEKMLKNKSLKEKTNIFTQGLKCSMSDTFVLILSDGNYIKCDFATLTNELTFINKNQQIISILRYNTKVSDMLHFNP